MTTYRTTAGVTTCDDCAEIITGTSWRLKAGHTAAHGRVAQLLARAARVKAMDEAETRCDSTSLGTILAAGTGRLTGHKAAPITSRGLTAKTIEES